MSTAATSITDDTTIEGNLTTASTLAIGGEVRGNVTAGGAITLMPDGVINGDVSGSDVTVHGSVDGRITATGKLVLSRTAVVRGDVTCRALQIDEGGTLLGRCDMGKVAEPQAAAKLADAKVATSTGSQPGIRAPVIDSSLTGVPPPPAFGGAAG